MSAFLICSFFFSLSLSLLFPSRENFLGKINACSVWPPGGRFAEIFPKTTVMNYACLNAQEEIAQSVKDSPLR